MQFNKPVANASYILDGKAVGVSDQISKDYYSYELNIKKLITKDVTITVTSKTPVYTTITGISGFATFLSTAWRDTAPLDHTHVINIEIEPFT